MSKRGNSYIKAHKRKKMIPGLLIGLIALVLICVVTIIGYKFYGNKTAAEGETSEYAVYDFEEYTLDSYGEKSTSMLAVSGEVTRCYVNIIETPSDGGVVTDPTYVSKGGSLELAVISVKSGYRFEGWYEGDSCLSNATKFTLKKINSDRVIYAKFSEKYISVISEAKEQLADSSLRKGGGTVSGGGILINDTSYVEINATPDDNYYLYGWIINNKGSVILSENKTTLVVGEKATSLTPASNKKYINISSDTTVTAIFKRTSNKFKVTLDMVPQVGCVFFSDDEDKVNEWGKENVDLRKAPPSYSYEYDISAKSRKIKCLVFYPTTKYSKKNLYKGDSFYLVKDNGSFEAIQGSTFLENICAGYLEYTIPANNSSDIHIITRLTCADPGGVVTVGAIPEAYPENAGTVTGGGTYFQICDFEITAHPKDGYEFVRWEWMEDGVAKTSGENPFTVRPDAVIFYKAIFAKKEYQISLASMTPMGCAEVTGLGPISFSESDKSRIGKINIKPLADFEVESVDYVMGGNNYSAYCNKTGGEVEIPNITDDVEVVIKLKRVSGYRITATVDYDGWMTIDGSGHVSYDPDAKCHASMKKDSEISTYVTDGSTPKIYNTVENNLSLSAFVDSGSEFKFVRWIRSDGKVLADATSPSIIVTKTDVDSDVTYTAQFEKRKVTIEAKADPEDKGDVSVTLEDGTECNNDPVDSGSNIILTAKPKTDVEFDCWIVGSSGRKLYGEKQKDGSNVLKLLNVTWNETYTAYFTNEEIDITLIVAPKDAGTVRLDDNTPISDSEVYHDIKNGSTISLSATAENGYKFVRWESLGQSGKSPAQYYSEPNIQIVNVKEDETYTAVFTEKDYVIKVLSSPVAGGTTYANNKTGEVSVLPGESVMLDAVPSKGYVFEYFTDSAGNKYTEDPLILNNIQGDDTFTAYYVEKSVSLTVNAEPPEGGTLKVNGDVVTSGNKIAVESGSNVNLEAVPAIGYSFVRWQSEGLSGAGPTAYTDPNTEILNVTADEIYTAVFAESFYTIKVVSAPITGGQTTVSGKPDEAKFLPGERATLNASPLSGYKFEYWTDSSGKRYTDNPLTIDVMGNETFTAHYVEGSINLTINAEPPEGGTLRVNGNVVTSGNKITVNSGSNVKLEAEPLKGYSFVRWQSEGRSGTGSISYTDPNTEILNVIADETYTAVFAKSYYTVKVVSSPVGGGQTTVGGKLDEAKFLPGEKATLNATPLNGYKFEYWTDSSGKRYTDNPLTIDVQGNETFTAHYVEEKLTITLEGLPQEAGYVKFNGNRVDYGKAIEIKSDSNITLSAVTIDDTMYEFERWENSRGVVYTSNPLTLLDITESDTYTAIFTPKNFSEGIKVVASPASGGTATKTMSADGSYATLKAVPRDGYSFVKWQKSGIDISTSPITKVTDLSDGLVYTAVFIKTSEVDVRSDIIKEYFYNDRRIYTAPVYAVSRDTVRKEAEERIAEERESQYDDSTPGLKDYQAVEEAKNVFDDIEIKEDKSVLLIDSELITTDAEVMPLSIVSDYSKEDEAAKEQTLKKFGNRYNYEILACKDVGIPDGFEDGIRTYLWKYQDVHAKDNIYILYDRKDGKYDWVSCIIDEGDTLRFTIDSIGEGCRMTIVKVTIE